MPNINYCPDLNEALTMLQVATSWSWNTCVHGRRSDLHRRDVARGTEAINTLPEDKLREYRIIYESAPSPGFQTDSQGQFFLHISTATSGAATRWNLLQPHHAPRLYLWLATTSAAPTARRRPRIVDLSAKGLSQSAMARNRGRLCRRPHHRTAALRDHRAPQGHERGHFSLTIDLTPRSSTCSRAHDSRSLHGAGGRLR